MGYDRYSRMDTTLLLVGIGLAAGFALISLAFFIQEKRKAKKVFFIKEATALGVITGIGNAMKADLSPLSLEFQVLTMVTLTGWTLVFLLLSLFFMGARRETLHWKATGPAVSIASVSVAAGVFTILGYGLDVYASAVLLWKVAFDLFAVFVFAYGAKVYIDANKKSPERRSSLMGSALVLVSISYAANIVLHEIPLFLGGFLVPGLNIEEVLDFVRIIALITICIVLITDLDYMYRIPISIYGIFAIAGSGVNLFSFEEKEGSADPNLFSGALIAIAQVLKEGTGSKAMLTRVTTGDREVIVESRPEHDLVVAAIAERSSLFLRRSTQIFADMFCDRFCDELKKEVGDADAFSEAHEMVHTAFPYLKH